MAQIAEAERRGSRVEARAVAHVEGAGQRVGGLAGGCREGQGGGRAGLGSVRAGCWLRRWLAAEPNTLGDPQRG